MQSINRAARRRSRRESAKRPQWGTLEEFARSRIQSWLQDVLEEEATELRLETDAARRYKKVANAEALIWKILMIAEKEFRRLNSPDLLGAVYDGQLFEDGMPMTETNPKHRAA